MLKPGRKGGQGGWGWQRDLKGVGVGTAQSAPVSPAIQEGGGGPVGLKVEGLDGDSLSTVLGGLDLRGFQDGELSVLKPGRSQANPNGGSPWQG